jgi:hypothetical protein
MMTARRSRTTTVRRRLPELLVFVALLAVAVLAGRPSPAGADGGGALVAEPVLSATSAGVRQLFGPSPIEAPGEIWGAGEAPGAERVDLVRYTTAGGWEVMADPVTAEGVVTSEMKIPKTATAGRTTPAGGVVVAATLAGEGSEALLVRDPGGQFRAVASPKEVLKEKEPEGVAEKTEEEEGEEKELEGEAEAEKPPVNEASEEKKEGTLVGEEQLFQYSNPAAPSWIKLAAVEEPSGKTGAFVLPYPGKKLSTAILHYDGSTWSREPICVNAAPASCEAPTGGFEVLALEATGPGNAWLLAKIPRRGPFSPGQGIALLRREGGEWRRQALGGPLGAVFGQEESELGGSKVFVSGREVGQPLTVSSKGVWVDAEIALGTPAATPFDATIYYDIGPGDPGEGKVTGSWCTLPASLPEAAQHEICAFPLSTDLAEGQSRSFAWPGSGAPGDFGTRAITGIGQGAMLIFENGAFTRVPLAGNGGTSAGAALSAPDQGWLGPSYRLTREPVPSGLVAWPVPFAHPLTAIVAQPGASPAAIESQALAVGDEGQVARYIPGEGWQPEPLLTGSGTRATPDLRGVAWPQPGVAYAVGDEGAMWLWRSGSGLWEPDPGAPPNLIRGNFTGIAFDPSEPERGYAVGKQGLLLGYGRRWTQEALPPEISPEVNFTSIAFAGSQALATYTIPGENETYAGGLLVNEGSGWKVEPAVSTMLAQAEKGLEGVSPWRVAGLPDGGAVIVGLSGGVIEREAAGAPWHPVPGTPLGYPAAVAAVREGGQLRAVVSVEANPIGQPTQDTVRRSDLGQADGQPPAGQAPLLTEPYALPQNGYIVRQTATGWADEERQSFPPPEAPKDEKEGLKLMDLPRVADPVLALLVSADGTNGWAVGGQTGEILGQTETTYLKGGMQTGAVMRYGNSAAPPENSSAAPISVPPTEATFAVGGNAQCAGPCGDLVGTGIGPDVWARAAVGRAAGIPGVRGFLYTGNGVSSNLDTTRISQADFAYEEGAYARRLNSTAGGLPVYATPAESDLYESSLSTFGAEFEGFDQPLGATPPPADIGPISIGDRAGGNYSYSFESRSTLGAEPVRVLVLDYATAPLSPEKQCWLAGQLGEAKSAGVPAMVVASREVGTDEALRQLLVTGIDETVSTSCPVSTPGAASAYLFDKPEANEVSSLAFGSQAIPVFGTGTLGYTRIPNQEESEFVGASGFLLVSVATAQRDPLTNIAPVRARLIPSIGSLAIYAVDGTLLRRSQTALFQGLARRPQAGISCSGNNAPEFCNTVKPDPYLQVPARCLRASCASELLPEYEFKSSRPDIANFVKVDPTSPNPRAVFLEPNGKPVADPTSGLLCAFNAGQTTVSITAGGFTYSIPITVQKGSVQRPCGTTALTELSLPVPDVPTPVEPFPETEPTTFTKPNIEIPTPPGPTAHPHVVPGSTPTTHPSPSPSPSPPPAHNVPHAPPTVTVPYFSVSTPGLTIVPPIVPLQPPPAPEPAPPTGTSPVTEPAVSPQPEEEEEAALDLVHHAVAVRHGGRASAALAGYSSGPAGGHRGMAIYAVPALVLIAALSTCGIAGGRRRRRSPEPAYLQHRR